MCTAVQNTRTSKRFRIRVLCMYMCICFFLHYQREAPRLISTNSHAQTCSVTGMWASLKTEHMFCQFRAPLRHRLRALSVRRLLNVETISVSTMCAANLLNTLTSPNTDLPMVARIAERVLTGHSFSCNPWSDNGATLY